MADSLDESACSSSEGVSLPVELIHDILRLVVNPAPGMSSTDHLGRQRAGAALTRTCKAFRNFVEPLLYKQIVLVRKKHLRRFGTTVESKRGKALVSRHTKALWVLCDSLSSSSESILEACRNLEHLVLRGNGTQMFCRRSIREIIYPRALRELTLIEPVGHSNLWDLKSLERLHIITGSVEEAHTSLHSVGVSDLTRIPKLCVEVTNGNWDGGLYSIFTPDGFLRAMVEQLEPRSNIFWLKIHDTEKRDWEPSRILSEEWWSSKTSLPITQDALDRIKITIVDEDVSVPIDPDKILRALEYNATHWVQLE